MSFRSPLASQPLRRLRAAALVLFALGTVGCGTLPTGYDPNSPYGYGTDPYGYGTDPYGTGSTGSYGSDPYGSGSTGYTGGSYSDPYSSGSTGSYGSGSTGSYGSDPYGTGTGYGSTTGYPTSTATPRPATAGSYGDYGTSYGEGQVTGLVRPQAGPTTPTALDAPVLVAFVKEVKETGFLGMGKIVAKVEVSNPGPRTLSGKLRVLFTDHGDPTPNSFVRKITLAPQEVQVLTFTADAWRLDDCEASIDTDPPTLGGGLVVDRTPPASPVPSPAASPAL